MAITAEKAIIAIKDSKGFVTTIAKRLDCAVSTVYDLIHRYPSVAKALENERESMIDFAEAKLFKQIDAENITAIIFFLKTQAKKRGYVEVEQTGAGGGPIAHSITTFEKALEDVYGNGDKDNG